MSVRSSFDAAEIVDAPSDQWREVFTTPLNWPYSHPARNCPDMTSALNQLIAAATTVESCRSSPAETA